MPEPRDAAFTSSRADAEFNARFHEPVKQMLTELTTDSGPVYERIGKCWSEVEGVLEALNESEAHKPAEGATHASRRASRPLSETNSGAPSACPASRWLDGTRPRSAPSCGRTAMRSHA